MSFFSDGSLPARLRRMLQGAQAQNTDASSNLDAFDALCSGETTIGWTSGSLDLRSSNVAGWIVNLDPTLSDSSAITGIVQLPAGVIRRVVAMGTINFTASSALVLLPTTSNAANTFGMFVGDVADFFSLGSGNWEMIAYYPSTATQTNQGNGFGSFIVINDFTNTSSTLNQIIFRRATGTTPGVGYASKLRWELAQHATPTVTQLTADQVISYSTITDSTFRGQMDFGVYDEAGGGTRRSFLTGGTSGTAATIGFLGASPSAQLSSPDLGTLVTTFGLASGTPTFAAANLTGTITSAKVGTGILTGYKSGFGLSFSSTTALLVGPNTSGVIGVCRDKTDAVTMTISGQQTITITNLNINGCDGFQPNVGTAATNSTTPTVTGTSTTFTTTFGTRAMTGTIASSGGAVTGTSTKFLTEITLGDLIGTAAKGYFQVTAIASDTALTLVSTPGSAFSGQTPNCIENPTIKVASQTVQQVIAIASDTSLTIASNSSATQSGQAYQIGVVPTVTTMPAANNIWLYVWVGTGGSGTAVWISTQRTTPFSTTTTGYNTNVRMIGPWLCNAGSLVTMTQSGQGNDLEYFIEADRASINDRLVSAGAATAWATLPANGVVPPGASAILVTIQGSGLANGIANVRRRGLGTANVTRGAYLIVNSASNNSSAAFWVGCDGVQAIDYANSSASLSTTIYVSGFRVSV